MYKFKSRRVSAAAEPTPKQKLARFKAEAAQQEIKGYVEILLTGKSITAPNGDFYRYQGERLYVFRRGAWEWVVPLYSVTTTGQVTMKKPRETLTSLLSLAFAGFDITQMRCGYYYPQDRR